MILTLSPRWKPDFVFGLLDCTLRALLRGKYALAKSENLKFRLRNKLKFRLRNKLKFTDQPGVTI